jgi:hypothetical protein
LKNGANFVLCGAVIWPVVALMWAFADIDIRAKSGIAWSVGTCAIPLAFLVGRLLKIPRTVKGNPLRSLLPILIASQFPLFPFLLYLLINSSELFIVFLPTVSAAHFFTYGWIYKSKLFYFFSSLMAISCTALAFLLPTQLWWWIPLAMGIMMGVFGLLLLGKSRSKV